MEFLYKEFNLYTNMGIENIEEVYKLPCIPELTFQELESLNAKIVINDDGIFLHKRRTPSEEEKNLHEERLMKIYELVELTKTCNVSNQFWIQSELFYPLKYFINEKIDEKEWFDILKKMEEKIKNTSPTKKTETVDEYQYNPFAKYH